jgi:hypothetical protein
LRSIRGRPGTAAMLGPQPEPAGRKGKWPDFRAASIVSRSFMVETSCN